MTVEEDYFEGDKILNLPFYWTIFDIHVDSSTKEQNLF